MEHAKDIILAIIGVITLADLLKFFFIKQDRKEKDITNKDKEITAIQHTNDILQQQLDRAAATIEKKEAENARLMEDRAELMATQSCLFDDMCIHKGCRLRKPHQGKGSLWYQKYKDDPTQGADYESIDTLLKRDRAERAAREKEAAVRKAAAGKAAREARERAAPETGEPAGAAAEG